MSTSSKGSLAAGTTNNNNYNIAVSSALIDFITAKLIPAALPVVTVDRSVHAALCIFHQVSGGRQTGRQTCRGKLMMSDQAGMRLGGECQDVEWCLQKQNRGRAYRVHKLLQPRLQQCAQRSF